MKKLILRLSLFTPLLVLIILINVIVDPVRLFQNKDYEKAMADALITGSAITDLQKTNFNDRIMEQFMIQELRPKRDIAVFGSSRVMLISSELFPGKTLLNNGVSLSTIQDFMCFYEMYRENKKLPSTIIIGVDPWVFNKNNQCIKWHWLDQYYHSRFKDSESRNVFDIKMRPQDLIPYDFQQLISISYMQSALQLLRTSGVHLFSKQQWFSLTHKKWNKDTTILPDGSRVGPKNYKWDDVEIKSRVLKEINNGVGIKDYLELDPGLKLKFIKLIQSMQADGVRVILFLPPYHPVAYNYYAHSDQFKIIDDVEKYLRNTAETYGLTVVGSYNPAQLSIPPSSFTDTLHLKDDTELKRIFSNVIE